MTPETKTNAAIALVRGFGISDFNWVWKDKVWYHRAIGWVFSKLGMPGYLDHFYTTLKNEVGRPNDAKLNGVPEEFEVFLHEGQHSIDAKRLTFPFFALIYGLPQWLGLLGVPLAVLLVLLTSSWLGLLGLLALAFLAPLPSPGRVWAELRGYRVSLSVIYWYEGIPEQYETDCINYYVSYFTGPSYYFMGSLSGASIRKKLEGYLADLKAGNGYQGDPYLTAVRDLALQLKSQDP
jgi:hypothetical protein